MKTKHYLQLETIPDEFKDGVRVLIATGRKKDGGVNQSDKKKMRMISRNKEEFDEIAKKMIDVVDEDGELSRVYASVNPRDINKAIREFKFNQLEADFYREEDRNSFYYDVGNRWISCLAKPHCNDGSKFLIDCDSQEEYKKAMMFCAKKNLERFWIYPSKNGMHIICEPFNPSELDLDIKKDGLFLIHFSRD